MSDQNVNTIHKLQIDGVDYVISATYLKNGNSKFDVSDIKTINGESILSENGGNIITSPIAFGNNDKDSVILRKTQGEATGNFSVALGADNLLGNIVDIPEGNDLIYVKASGYASHAEGAAHAIGDYSHAEGGGNVVVESHPTVPTAEGSYSHAEGTHTWAKGPHSHAEGGLTIAELRGAHAEGYKTHAKGGYSHAEGVATFAESGAHAEGGYRDLDDNIIPGGTASGISSHAEGQNTLAKVKASHAEGIGTTAGGQASHAEGNGTTASGHYSHSEGDSTSANQNSSHAEGKLTVAKGIASHSEGYGTISNNKGEHAEGLWNKSNKSTIHSVGIGTSDDERYNAHEISVDGKHYIYGIGNYVGDNPTNDNDLVSIINTKADITYVDQKIDTEIADLINDAPKTYDTLKEIADYIASDKEGAVDMVSKISKVTTRVEELESDNIIGKGAVNNSAVLKGSNNTVTGKYSVALGSNNSVSGSSSATLGYNNTVNQNCCFATGANNSVSGANSSVDGLNTIVEGHESHAEGSGTKVFGHASHGEGMNGEIYGDFAHVEGLQSMVYAHSSHAEGVSCIAGDVNQKDLVADEKTDGACHAEGVGTSSIGLATHTEGKGTIATGIASHSEGLNTKSGLKGYYFKGVDLKNNKIYLSTTKPEIIETKLFSSVVENWKNNPYKVNDIVSIINGDVYYDLKVIEIKGNIIKVENLPFSSISEVNEMLGDSNYTVFCLSQYRSGVVNISIGSHAEGHNTRSFGIATHSEGHGTIAKNVGEHASGIYNVSNGDTQFSIGVGTSEDDRKNAFEVKQNGDIYIEGVSNTLQSNINNANDTIDTLIGNGEGSIIQIVKDEIAKVVASAPDTLDTLEEIAKYIELEDSATSVAKTLSNHSESIKGLEKDSIIVKGDGENSVVLKGGNNKSTGIGSISLGIGSTAEGKYSFASGNSVASGDYSHSEGVAAVENGVTRYTKAIGKASHAEGEGCHASATGAHAEGMWTDAQKNGSHAEGYKTVAGGQYSHVEGNDSQTIGNISHAEGKNCIAKGRASHAEGWYTIANNEGEHASGKYNVSNTDTQFSIGIGSSDNNRKNAFEVKKNGDIYIEGIGGFIGDNSDKSEDVASVIQKLENKHPIIGLIHNDIVNSKSSLDLIYSLIKSSNLAPYIQGFVSNITSETTGAIVGSYTIISVGIANS